MLAWTVLLLAAGLLVDAAKPDPPDIITTVGSQKLATASDCSKPVAFSGTHANIENARLILTETLLDKGVGYASNTGIFTTFCPGLYQFSFAGYGSSDLRLTLKRKLSKTETWQPVVSSGPSGGANIVLLRMALGDQVAVFVDSGKTDDSTTFSGYRIAKE
ncbi:C1q-like venom protein precursor [Nasonia vitripennis]|uniref:C1q-like venom protein n=1 Tax=Nasonia vitripennis TaxID=7425 RepID=B8Y9E1_NASVI|nr:C1q-like venom protein precursor [Nasonia vitripennis]ACL54975.1 C1q-like venom protein [Nasonia vitripennis]